MTCKLLTFYCSSEVVKFLCLNTLFMLVVKMWNSFLVFCLWHLYCVWCAVFFFFLHNLHNFLPTIWQLAFQIFVCLSVCLSCVVCVCLFVCCCCFFLGGGGGSHSWNVFKTSPTCVYYIIIIIFHTLGSGNSPGKSASQFIARTNFLLEVSLFIPKTTSI